MRGFHSLSHTTFCLRSRVRSRKKFKKNYISTFIRFITSKLVRVLTSGRWRTQTPASSPTFAVFPKATKRFLYHDLYVTGIKIFDQLLNISVTFLDSSFRDLRPMFKFYTPLWHTKPSGFLTFSRGIEMEHCPRMACNHCSSSLCVCIYIICLISSSK